MATEYATLTFIAETDSLVRAEKRLNSVARTGARTQKAVTNVSTSAAAAGRSFGGMGRNAGQAGIQIQQLVGQVQAGTNPMVALSQQATDLGFVLGAPMIGAVTGLAAAIAGPLIASLFNGSDALAEFRDEIEESIDKFDELTAREQQIFIRDTEQRIASQREEMGKLEAQITEAEEAVRRFSLQGRSIAAARERERIDELAIEFGELEREVTASEEALESARESLTGTADDTEAASSAAQRFVERLQEQAETIGMTRTETLLYKAAQLELNEAQMEQVRIAAERLEQYDQERQALEQRMAAEERAWEEMKRLRDQQQEMEREQKEKRLATERAEREQQAQEREKANQKRIEDERFLNETLLGFEDQLLKGKSEKQKAGYRTLVNIMNAEKRERAQNIVSKSFGVAMDAYGALAPIPIVGPALGAAAAATVIAAGVSFAAQSLQGRALGGQVRAGESYVVGERGPEVLTMGTNTGRIIPNEAMRGGDGETVNRTTNVTFQISTVDARGFDQLLQSRRGQIISMINSASNDRGRRAVV